MFLRFVLAGCAVALSPLTSGWAQPGPSQPVGNQLRDATTQKRVKALIEESIRKFKIDTTRPEASSMTTELQEGSFPALWGANYGFKLPGTLKGTPKAFLSLNPNFNKHVLVMEKLHYRLSLFRINKDGHPKLVKSYRAITGKDPRDKRASGDLRSPEGLYYFTARLKDVQLPPKYGRMAYVLNYPNHIDKALKKTGYGIWLHATDNPDRLQRPFDTEGCIAVSNENIVELKRYISLKQTPIIVTKEMKVAKPSEIETEQKQVFDMLKGWKSSWENNDLTSYINYYSDHFRQNRMDKSRWLSYKKNLAKNRPGISVGIFAPQAFAMGDQLWVTFNQLYKSSELTDVGRKTLVFIWENGRYRILRERWRRLKQDETELAQYFDDSHPRL